MSPQSEPLIQLNPFSNLLLDMICMESIIKFVLAKSFLNRFIGYETLNHPPILADA